MTLSPKAKTLVKYIAGSVAVVTVGGAAYWLIRRTAGDAVADKVAEAVDVVVDTVTE